MSLFGKEFVNEGSILIILSAGQFINLITGSVGYLLQMTGHEHAYQKNLLYSFFLVSIGSLVIIPTYGITRAAYITSTSIAFTNLMCVYDVKKYLGFNTLKIL